jgi:hypothetical protein
VHTQCNHPTLTGEPLGSRDVLACFDGGHVTSDAGGLLLREGEAKFRFVEQFARCFADYRIVARLREVWPGVVLVVRADSGFCREHLMRWCEANGVEYLLGLAKNKRLQEALTAELHQAQQQFAQTGQPTRVFKDFRYRTLDSWSRERRVVGKAEHLAQGPNPRFVVTSLTAAQCAAGPLYEQEYCGRGDMENRIKEQQLMLFANRGGRGRGRRSAARCGYDC